jgi:hypothetical protein
MPKGGEYMRRLVSVLTVAAALMAVMVVVASPAFARPFVQQLYTDCHEDEDAGQSVCASYYWCGYDAERQQSICDSA